MNKTILERSEIESIQELLGELTSRYDSAEDPRFLRSADVFAHELPRRLRGVLRDFRLTEPMGALCVISGYPINEEKIGQTPRHWKEKHPSTNSVAEEMLLVLFGALLGDPIGWATQQDGRIVHDIFPIRGHETEQLGSGGEQGLFWHTEDAFHPFRGDYLGMMCLKNPDSVATTFASMEKIRLTPEQIQILSEPHYTIRPDESHRVKYRGETSELDAQLEVSYRKIEETVSRPRKVPVLFGATSSPYIRLDPYLTDPVQDNEEAQQALDELFRQVDAALTDLVLQPGDFCFIDNYKAVHGRKPFKARHDGRDRWLKRLNITRDLRKSREARLASDSRVIH
ncbi:guanitoxin biosynthesis L-enduracididine beta-hydroxylase GntD [Archangium lipolyticum]|uniref:guanitoxin biosynthesis L-enduracididine beta-hydroxylase GntD n=1 Tax=Archangium lipolyticum TaxID=2970465 RepID=UPI002149A71F|nr:guanitoxin biosynthesis L-enduracididine beta-hydroxylase GntD [Archangium lipolyticum]